MAWHFFIPPAIYQEITPPQRIIYLAVFSDAAGNVAENMPKITMTIEFVEQASKTKMISRAQCSRIETLKGLPSMGMIEGFNQSLDRLEALLAKA